MNSEEKSLDSSTTKCRLTFSFVFLLEASESVSCTSADTSILTLFFLFCDSVGGFGVLGSEFAGEACGLGVCGREPAGSREGRLSDWFL